MNIRGIELECEFEHEKGEPATPDHPGYPDIYTLTSAMLGGVDILQVLDPAIVMELERRAAWL
tara:strand:- start:2030 stop:2218 length:189 start_codon:yes stop_codon:yes gene_type:complete